MNAVIYARYSSNSQRETSIEEQVEKCAEYARRKNYTVIDIYSDSAMTGKNDERPALQKMLRDCENKVFDVVIVYSIDRFGRNLKQLIINSERLEKNGILLESITEHFSNTPSGTLFRNIMMSYSQFYSEEMAEKIKRGMDYNAQRCMVNGGAVPLGYKIENKYYVKDETTAPIVKEIFTKYANDWSQKEICDSLNERHIKTSKGTVFNRSSLNTLLKNKKYIGFYKFGNIEKPDGMPRIIDNELFERVQEKMRLNKKNPGRARAKAEYILTTKLFCGYCKEKMVGHSANKIGKNGIIYNYYKCKNSGANKPCHKKMINKDFIEDTVVKECVKLLTSNNIKRIAKEVVKISKSLEKQSEFKRLNQLLKQAKREKENQMKNLRICKDSSVREMILEDLVSIGTSIKELQIQIAVEKSRQFVLTEKQIIDYLTKLSKGNINDLSYRKMLIRLFVERIYLYDDKYTIIFSAREQTGILTERKFDIIKEKFEGGDFCLSNQKVHQKPICIAICLSALFVFVSCSLYHRRS